MKNILFVFFIFHCLMISAVTNERHVHIHFKVTNGFGEVTNFIIREIYENGKIDTVQAIEANHILDLPVNHKILLEIICPHHVTRRIAINTTVPDDLVYIPFYELFFDLIETDVVNLQPNRDEILELLLFPVGYVTYNFEHNSWDNTLSEFTKTINKLLKKNFK
jgi:hypothetical protein